jgi:hypothetical protein
MFCAEGSYRNRTPAAEQRSRHSCDPMALPLRGRVHSLTIASFTPSQCYAKGKKVGKKANVRCSVADKTFGLEDALLSHTCVGLKPTCVSPMSQCLQCLDAICSVNRQEEWATERNAIGRTHARLKRAGGGTNGTLECKFPSKNAQRNCLVDSLFSPFAFYIASQHTKGSYQPNQPKL